MIGGLSELEGECAECGEPLDFSTLKAEVNGTVGYLAVCWNCDLMGPAIEV